MDSILKRFKKQCMVAFLAAGMILGATSGAQAIDFKASGEWLVGFGLGNAAFQDGDESQGGKNDYFTASQRIRLQLDAVASENLSGRVWFEIGTQDWGNAGQGAALGADGVAVEVKNAYIDWLVPNTDLQFRMGLQALSLPNAAGGSAIMDSDVAAVLASYKFTDEVGLTAFWMRPVNDNFNDRGNNGEKKNFLDNIDLFGISLPLTFDGFEITPWLMYGMMGRYSLHYDNEPVDGELRSTLLAYIPGQDPMLRNFKSTIGYSDMFWAGLPIKVTAWDPLNIEFDVNYGYVGGFGVVGRDPNGFTLRNYKSGTDKHADSKREGWLVKALVEYKMDWGVPGIFGWYSSGDDGDVKNGSERMPSIAAAGSFTSFMGCAGIDEWANGTRRYFYEKDMSYSGTWGIGLQIRDMSFLEDLSHTFRVAYWGGTNSPSMVEFFNRSYDGMNTEGYDGPYLTTNDGLLEFNLDNTYKIYENLAVNLDLGYIVNMYDRDTWSRSWTKGNGDFDKRDAWKAQLTFAYSF